MDESEELRGSRKQSEVDAQRKSETETETEDRHNPAVSVKGCRGAWPLSSSQLQSLGVLAVLSFWYFDFTKRPLCDFIINVPILKLD